MSYSYETAVVVAAEAATKVTRVTKGATRIELSAVYPQRSRTLTIPPTRRICRPTGRSCPIFLSKDLRTVVVSAVAPTIPDSKGPIVLVRFKLSSRVHGDQAPNSTTPRTLSLATLASTKLTTTPIPRVLARIGALVNSLVNTAQCLPFLQSINRNPTSQSQSVPQRTHVSQLATRLSWLLTKSWGLVMTCTVHLLTRIRFGLTGMASLMTRGTRTAPTNWYWFGIYFCSTDRFRTESFFQVTRPNWLGNVESTGCRNHFDDLESCGHAPVCCTAFEYNACCGLYINRLTGYMIPIDGTSDVNLLNFWLALRVFFVCEFYSRARRTYGNACWYNRYKCDVYERTTFKCNVWEPKLQVEHWPWDGKANSPSNNSARNKNSDSPVAQKMLCWPLTPHPATLKRGLVHRTLFSKVVISIQGHTCAQVFTNGSFTTVHPLDLKAKVAQALTEFADNVGISDSLLSDGAPEIVGPRTDFTKEVNRIKIKLKRSEVGRSNQNYAAELSDVKCHPACGITAWYMRPTSWIGFPADNRSALELKSSLAKRQTYPIGLTLNFAIKCGTMTRNRSKLTGVAHRVGATYVIGYYLSLEKWLPVLQYNTSYATTIWTMMSNATLRVLTDQSKSDYQTRT